MKTTLAKLGLTLALSTALTVAVVVLFSRQAPAAPIRGRLLGAQPDGSTIKPTQTLSGTWGPGTITATTDVTITAGVIITVTPGTTIMVSPTDSSGAGVDAGRVEFLVQNGAALRVNGPVTFTSRSATPSAADWYGIRFIDGSSGWLDQVTIEFGVHALTLDTLNAIRVSNSVLRHNRHAPAEDATAYGAGIAIVSGAHLITSTHVYENVVISTGDAGQAFGGGVDIQGAGSSVINSLVYNNALTSTHAAVAVGAGVAVRGGANGSTIDGSQVTTNTVRALGNSAGHGGGIGIHGATAAVISGNLVASNRSDSYIAGGGGIGLTKGATAALIAKNILFDNVALTFGNVEAKGGGISSWDDNSVIIRNNLVISNAALSPGDCQEFDRRCPVGGGMLINAASGVGVRVYNNTIVGNRAVGAGEINGEGGGIFLEHRGFAANNILVGNHAHSSGGGIGRKNATSSGEYNGFFNNTAPTNPNQDFTSSGNLVADPLFVGAGNIDESYHLQQGSPALDLGTDTGVGLPNDDYDGDPRPLGDGWDLGFDEVIPFTYAKSVNLAIAAGGDVLTYTIVITNPDPISTIVGAQITDALPLNTTYSGGPVCDLGWCGFDSDERVITWTGDIPADSALNLGYAVTVDTGLAEGTEITNAAHISLEGPRGPTNAVTTVIFNPAFTLTKSVSGTAVAGALFDYTIVVTNASKQVGATNVVVTDALPAGAHYASGGDNFDKGVVSWIIPAVASDTSQEVSFVISACQTVTNSWYRVVDSDQSVGSDWGAELVTGLTEPTIDAGFDYAPVDVAIGGTVYFTDTSTTDGGALSERIWDFGDGDMGGSVVVTHTYTAAGSYTVTLWLTDSCGFSSTAILPEAVVVSAPEIDVSPQQLNAALMPTGTTTRTLIIANLSSVVLTWTVAEAPDVPWLSLPDGAAVLPGATPPMESSEVLVTYDATDLSDSVYTTTLAVTSNDPTEPQVDISVTLTVTTHTVYGVKVTGVDTDMSGHVGQVLTYTQTVTNLANVDDSFTVDLDGNGWPATASAIAFGPLAPGATYTLDVYVAIPAGATDGLRNELVVTVISAGDPSVSDSVVLTTTAIWCKLYLPLVSKDS